MLETKFTFTAPIWEYTGKAAWFFVTLPKETAAQIKFMAGDNRRGWGSIRVDVQLGNSRWKTSIFPSKELESYVLPIKAAVRKEENVTAGDEVTITLDADLDV